MNHHLFRLLPRLRSLVVPVAAAFLLAGRAPAEEISLQPFVIDHYGRADSPIDLTFLLGHDPAGKDGFVTRVGVATS